MLRSLAFIVCCCLFFPVVGWGDTICENAVVREQTKLAQTLLQENKYEEAYKMLKKNADLCSNYKLPRENVETYYQMMNVLLQASIDVKDYVGCKRIGDEIYQQFMQEDFVFFSSKLDAAIKNNLEICERKILEPYPLTPKKCSIKGYEDFLEIPKKWKGIWLEVVCVHFYEPQENFSAFEPEEEEDKASGLKHLPYVEVLYVDSVSYGTPEDNFEEPKVVTYDVTKIYFKDVEMDSQTEHDPSHPSLWGGDICGMYDHVRFGDNGGEIYVDGAAKYCWQGSAEFNYFLKGTLRFPFSFDVKEEYLHAIK